MIVIAGAVLVLPDRVVDEGSILIDGGRIVAIEPRIVDTPRGATRVDGSGGMIVPGFIDVHVHGVEGIDVLDGPGAVAQVAAQLPKYGVTAFCPTTVACPPAMLDSMLDDLGRGDSRRHPNAQSPRVGDPATALTPDNVSARVLPAHLESNFINADYKGAQPADCLRVPRRSGGALAPAERQAAGAFTGADILTVIERRRDQIGIITVAPEIEGGLDLVQQLTAAGHRVAIGHSGATYEQTVDAIAAGVTHATHLFNRMSPMLHRAPGIPGAVLHSEDVRAELICDSFHVHPALVRVAIRAKGIGGVMAISDGTAGAGLPVGSRARLGGRPIVVTDRSAELEDGTVAGSVLTLDGGFRMLVGRVGVTVVEAARLCATTPAEQLRLVGMGRLVAGGLADLVILDRETLRVRSTMVNGRFWNRTGAGVV